MSIKKSEIRQEYDPPLEDKMKAESQSENDYEKSTAASSKADFDNNNDTISG